MGDRTARGTYKLAVGESIGGVKKVCVGGGFAIVDDGWKPPGRPASGSSKPSKPKKAKGTFKLNVGEALTGVKKVYIGGGEFRMVDPQWAPGVRG